MLGDTDDGNPSAAAEKRFRTRENVGNQVSDYCIIFRIAKT